MTQKRIDTCPLSDTLRSSTNDSPHVESRFGALESDVRGLRESHEHLETVVTRGFENIFAKIDLMGKDFNASIERKNTMRSSEVVTKLANTTTIVILVAGFLYQNFSGVAASVVRSESAATLGITKAEGALALANTRELQYREDKGRSEKMGEELATKIKELDMKLQNETRMTAERLEERLNALDDKLQIESKLQMRNTEVSMAKQEEYTTEMRAWRLKDVEQCAYSRGQQDATIAELQKNQKIIEDRQYFNTGVINALKPNGNKPLAGDGGG